MSAASKDSRHSSKKPAQPRMSGQHVKPGWELQPLSLQCVTAENSKLIWTTVHALLSTNSTLWALSITIMLCAANDCLLLAPAEAVLKQEWLVLSSRAEHYILRDETLSKPLRWIHSPGQRSQPWWTRSLGPPLFLIFWKSGVLVLLCFPKPGSNWSKEEAGLWGHRGSLFLLSNFLLVVSGVYRLSSNLSVYRFPPLHLPEFHKCEEDCLGI